MRNRDERNIVILVLMCLVLITSCFTSAGCSRDEHQTIIKDKNIAIEIPDIIVSTQDVKYTGFTDSLLKNYTGITEKLPDTAFIAVQETTIQRNGQEVITHIKYYPKQNKFVSNTKQTAVKATYTDTTKHVTINKTESLWDKMSNVIILLGIVLILGCGLVFSFRLKTNAQSLKQ